MLRELRHQARPSAGKSKDRLVGVSNQEKTRFSALKDELEDLHLEVGRVLEFINEDPFESAGRERGPSWAGREESGR